MRALSLFVLLFLPLLAVVHLSRSDASEEGAADAVARLEGGDPVPAGPFEIVFPWIGKQSVMCVGESVERQIAFADFTDDAIRDHLGTIRVDADGKASGRFQVPVSEVRTGHASRDEKLQGSQWLDAETHPNLTLDITGAERVKPTVWRIRGTWTMHGITRPVEMLANVRYVAEMQNVGKDLARVDTSFTVHLKAHDVGGAAAGTPAVAEAWQVDVVALGLIRKP